MARMVRGTLPLVALAAAVPLTGCGTMQAAGSAQARPEAAMTAALLSAREVPEGWLPAEKQRVLHGIRPADPDCARLLRIADADSAQRLRGVRNVPEGHAAYYLAAPGATLAQHVFRLPPGRAAAVLAEARRSVAKCPKLELDVGDDRQVRLRRTRLPRPKGFPNVVAVRYERGAGADRTGLDVLIARAGDDLLVVTAPGAFGGGGAKSIQLAEARALRKLRAVHRGKISLAAP